MIKFTITLSLTILTNMLLAQTTIVTGRIMDAADSTALVGTTVVIDDGKINAMCDGKGYFTLRGVPKTAKEIRFVMLGYTARTMPLALTSSKVDMGSVFLSEERNQIDAVVVQSDTPMSIQKGDTTQFNAAAFKTNPDADADDLIMKMPGVVIQNGKIEAQGEPIRKIYVDGKLFFGTDPMAALKNLPADAVESVQLFDEPSEQARITGFDDGETNKAINIVTKTKSKESTILKMESSAGADVNAPNRFRYLAGGNFSRFTAKDRITVTALTNNVNTMRFSQSDMNGDGGVDSNGNSSGQSMGVQKINGVGLNYSRDTEKLRFSGSYFFDNNNNETERFGQTNYFANPPKFDTKVVNTINRTEKTSYNNKLNFRLELKPNEKNTFILSPNIRIQNGDYLSANESYTMQDGDSLNRVRGSNPSNNLNVSITGEALYVRKFEKKGRSISLGLTYSLNENSSDRYQREIMRDNFQRPNKDATEKEWVKGKLNNRFIDQENSGNMARLKLTYAEPFAKYHRILFNYIMSRDWGSSNKQTRKFVDDTQDYTRIDTAQCSHFERDYNTIGMGVGYAFYRKHYTLNAGIDFQRLDQTRDEFQPNVSQTKLKFYDFQPSVSFKYTLQKSKYIRVNYRGRTQLPRIEQMQNVIDDSSPSNIRIGNPDLKEGYRHSLMAFYNGTNIKKSTNLTVTLSATTISNFIASSIESTSANRDDTIYVSKHDEQNRQNGFVPVRGAFVHRYVNLDGYLYAQASVAYSFALKPIKSNMNIALDYNYIRTPSIYTTLNYANINSGSLRVGLTSNISENVDFNIYSSTSFNFTDNSAKVSTSFLNENLYFSTNIIFWKSFVFNSVFTWKYYKSSIASQGSSSYYLWNAGLGKKMFKRRNGEFRITAYDVLNQNKNILHYVRNNAIEDVRTNTLGRYVLARFSYRFNSMSQHKPASMAGREVRNMNVKQFKKEEARGGQQ